MDRAEEVLAVIAEAESYADAQAARRRRFVNPILTVCAIGAMAAVGATGAGIVSPHFAGAIVIGFLALFFAVCVGSSLAYERDLDAGYRSAKRMSRRC